MLGIPQSAPGSNHVVCRQLGRTEGQLPSWMSKGPSQSRLRRQRWKVEEDVVKVQTTMGNVWDAPAEIEGVQGWGLANGDTLCAGGR